MTAYIPREQYSVDKFIEFIKYYGFEKDTTNNYGWYETPNYQHFDIEVNGVVIPDVSLIEINKNTNDVSLHQMYRSEEDEILDIIIPAYNGRTGIFTLTMQPVDRLR